MGPRYPEVDTIKAAAIVSVVLIHALHPFWLPHLPLPEEIILRFTRFAVPSFLTASGFLYYSATPITGATMARRYRRLLLPYCCVSIAAYVYGLYFPQRLTVPSFWAGLLFGGLFGPYYYVFVSAVFVAFTWVLSRLRAPLVWVLCIVALMSTAAVEVSLIDGQPGAFWRPLGFWMARSPQLWGGWFMLGWVAAWHKDAVLRTTLRYRTPLLTAWAVLVAIWLPLACAHWARGPLAGVFDLLLTLANIVGLFVLGRGVKQLPSAVTRLSNWTYSIYLVHPFFVYAVQDVIVPRLHLSFGSSAVLAWMSGILGAVAVAELARRTLGRYARDVVGV